MSSLGQPAPATGLRPLIQFATLGTRRRRAGRGEPPTARSSLPRRQQFAAYFCSDPDGLADNSAIIGLPRYPVAVHEFRLAANESSLCT